MNDLDRTDDRQTDATLYSISVSTGVTCRDVIGHVTIGFPMAEAIWKKPLSLTVSEIFNDKCEAMVYVTLSDL